MINTPTVSKKRQQVNQCPHYKIYEKGDQREQSQTTDTAEKFKEILHHLQVFGDSQTPYRSHSKSAHHPTGYTALSHNLDIVFPSGSPPGKAATVTMPDA